MITADMPPKNPVIVRLSEPGEDLELKAISYIDSILKTFTESERRRMLGFLIARDAARRSIQSPAPAPQPFLPEVADR